MKRIVERVKKFMNTDITIKVIQIHEPTIQIQNIIEEAFGEFERIVKRFSRFDESSELSNLNRNSGNSVVVSEEMFFLVEKMLEYYKKTESSFDPTIIGFLEAHGYDRSYNFSKLNDTDQLEADIKNLLQKQIPFDSIVLYKRTSRITLKEGQRLDLGGIGKGYAIDCAAKKISEVTKSFLIDAGGDIFASGLNEKDKVWSVELKAADHSGGEKNVGTIELENMAIAASGSWARRVGGFHHLIDPVSGKPALRDFSTVFVLADSAMDADVWATALFIKPELAGKIDFKSMFV